MNRRAFLQSAAALGAMSAARSALACGNRAQLCMATGADIEGPYYLPGAPQRPVLLEAGMEGTVLEFTGTLRDRGACRSMAGTSVELWQCDARGNYDMRGMRLRTRLVTDASGSFGLRTIVPGRYLNGAQFRPAHIHVKVRSAGRILTTQLYFQGDPHNAADPWFRQERALALVSAGREYRARFDFVI